ncbi:MAG TPA: hypothetical protein VHB21_19745 [Minicystis sp.]|nr:hypothetical protein [Minicystis sp.]
MSRVLPIVAAVAVVAAWGGAVWMAASKHAGASAAPVTATRLDNEAEHDVKAELRDIKGTVLGKSRVVRGDKVIAPVVRPQEQDFAYTPREVCVRLKLDYPDQYKNLDCSKPEYDSPHSWNEWGD